MLCSWEGNRRSGVALAMRHRLSGLSTYGLNGLDREMSTPAYTPEGHDPLYLFCLTYLVLCELCPSGLLLPLMFCERNLVHRPYIRLKVENNS